MALQLHPLEQVAVSAKEASHLDSAPAICILAGACHVFLPHHCDLDNQNQYFVGFHMQFHFRKLQKKWFWLATGADSG